MEIRQSERDGKKWQFSLKAVREAIHEQITERIQEMGSYIDQDVKSKLNGMCEMFRVSVGGSIINFPGKASRIRAMSKKFRQRSG